MENAADRVVGKVLASIATDLRGLPVGQEGEVDGALVTRRGQFFRVSFRRKMRRFGSTAVYDQAEDAALAILMKRHFVVRTPGR